MDASSAVINIAAVKPERARRFENNIIERARNGQILKQMTEEEVITMLRDHNEKQQKASSIRFRRKKSLIDNMGYNQEMADRLGINIDGWDAVDESSGKSQYTSEEVFEDLSGDEGKAGVGAADPGGGGDDGGGGGGFDEDEGVFYEDD
jgi:hypothetical protein